MRLDFCVACNTRDQLHFHHLVPRVLGGPDTQDNLITLCSSCHDKMHRLQERGLLNAATLSEVGAWLALAEGRTPEPGGTNLVSNAQAEAADAYAESLRPHVEAFLQGCSPQSRPTFAKLARYLTAAGIATRLGSTSWASGQVYDLIGRLRIDWQSMKNANRSELLAASRNKQAAERKAAAEADARALAIVQPHIDEFVRIVGKTPPALWVASKLNELKSETGDPLPWTAVRLRGARARIPATMGKPGTPT